MSDENEEAGIEDLDDNAKFYGFEEDSGDVEIPDHLPVLALQVPKRCPATVSDLMDLALVAFKCDISAM